MKSAIAYGIMGPVLYEHRTQFKRRKKEKILAYEYE